ncbi:MAG: hypothetical protein A4S09_09485 [Proteobacteria bacterium SG_bin7]|nr:MAG: hypothetical protein A4S09_09485 [Proteobacteria bacterium SG_bin7]
MTIFTDLLNLFANWPPAFIALLCGVTCGILGPFFVWRNLSFLGDALSHSSLTPLALATLIGVTPVAFLLPFNLLMALTLSFLAIRRPLNLDSYISIMFAGFLGLGLLISHFAGANGESLLEILFGNILETNSFNSFLTFSVTIAVIGHLIFWRHDLYLLLLNRDLAAVEGVRVQWHEILLMILLAIVVTIGIKLMGTVLLTSLIVTPTVVARVFAKNLRSLLILASFLGAIFAVVGVGLAQKYSLPASGTVATFCLFSFLVSLRFKPQIN